MRTLLRAGLVSMLAVSCCAATVRRPNLAIPEPAPAASAKRIQPVARTRVPRKSFRSSARLRAKIRLRTDEPTLVIFYGERPGSWM